jgi:hypothetical protein
VNADDEVSQIFGEPTMDRFAQLVVFCIIEEADATRWFLSLADEPSRIR